MSANIRKKEIGGKEYGIVLPPVRNCMLLANRVALLVGPLLPALKQESDSEGWAKLGGALQSVDPIKMDALFMDAVTQAKLCCDNASVSSPVTFEQHFGQYRGDVYQVALWCLWECISDFFPQLEGLTQVAVNAAMGAFQSPPGGRSSGGSADQSGQASVPGGSLNPGI